MVRAKRRGVGGGAGRPRAKKNRSRLAYDAADVYREARTLAQTVATGLRLLAMAETDWIKIHYNNWTPEDGKSPIDKWTATWIESGAATVMPGGHVRLLLPATLGEVAGAETEIPDIRPRAAGRAAMRYTTFGWRLGRRTGRCSEGRRRTGTGWGLGVGMGWGREGIPRWQLSSLAPLAERLHTFEGMDGAPSTSTSCSETVAA